MSNLYISKLRRRHASAATQTRSLKAIANAALVLIDLYGVKNGNMRVFDNLPVAGAVVAWSNVHAALKKYGITETVGAVVNSTVPTPAPVPTPTPVPNPTPTPTPVPEPTPTPTPVPNPTPTPTPVPPPAPVVDPFILGNYVTAEAVQIRNGHDAVEHPIVVPLTYKCRVLTLSITGSPDAQAVQAFYDDLAASYWPANRKFCLVRLSDMKVMQWWRNGVLEPATLEGEVLGNCYARNVNGAAGVTGFIHTYNTVVAKTLYWFARSSTFNNNFVSESWRVDSITGQLLEVSVPNYWQYADWSKYPDWNLIFTPPQLAADSAFYSSEQAALDAAVAFRPDALAPLNGDAPFEAATRNITAEPVV